MLIDRNSHTHLTYCLNVHRGETWSENLAAIREHASAIDQVSAERIGEEIVMILTEGNSARAMDLMLESGLMSAVLPEVIRSLTIEIQKLDVAGWVVTGYFVSYAISMTFMGRVSPRRPVIAFLTRREGSSILM